MRHVIEFPLEGGQQTLVEIDVPEQDGIQRASRLGEIFAKSTKTFEATLESIIPAINAIVTKLGNNITSADQTEVEFGIKFGAQAEVFIASAEAEANITVKLTWKRQE
jgi:hypothetical protein